MKDNFLDQLRKSARTPDAVKKERIEEEKRKQEAHELDSKQRQSTSIETIYKIFFPICEIIQETAIKAVEQSLYTEKNNKKYLEGQVRLRLPQDDDRNGFCYCRFSKQTRVGLKKHINHTYSKRIIIDNSDYRAKIEVSADYGGGYSWLIKQIDKMLKKLICENIAGVVFEKDARLRLDDTTHACNREYELDFKIFF